MKNFFSTLLLVVFFSACYKTDPEVLKLLNDIKSQNESLRGQVTNLQRSTDSLALVLRNTNLTINNIDKKVDSLKAQLSLVLQQINSINVQLTQANSNILDLQLKIAELNKKCEELLQLLNQYIMSVNLSNLSFVKVQSSDAFTLVGTNIPGQYFLITRTTVLKSTDFGVNWTSTNWPLGIIRNGTSTAPGGAWSNSNNGQFISGTIDNGFYTTSNLGTTYSQSGPTGFGCASNSILTLPDGKFLATMSGFQRGIYKSSGSSNTTWKRVWTNNGDAVDFTYYKNKIVYSCHTVSGCCPGSAILRSNDDGDTWNEIAFNPNNGIWDVEIIEDSLAWIDQRGNFYISNASNPKIDVSPIYNFISKSAITANTGQYESDMKYSSIKKVLAVTSSTGLFISTDFGKSWKNYLLNGASTYYNLTFVDDYLFICTNVGVFRTKI